MRLYNYLSLEHAIDNLVKRRIKISTYDDMNDPFELRGAWMSDADFHRALTEVSKKGGVVCFSEMDSEVLLWSHYAVKHRGCCIDFEVAESEALQPTVSVKRPKEISFDRSPSYEMERLGIESGDSSPESHPGFEEAIKRYLPRTTAILFSKYEGWNYEKERRLLIKLQPSQKDGNHYFAEFDGNIRPVEVLLGARCTQADEERLRPAVNGYDPPLPIIRTGFAKDEFKIVRL
jgi:hypothetical protein